MKILLFPWYRTARCDHTEPDLSGCDTCGSWEVEVEWFGVPLVGQSVHIHTDRMVGGPAPDTTIVPEDDYREWIVTDVAWYDVTQSPHVSLSLKTGDTAMNVRRMSDGTSSVALGDAMHLLDIRAQIPDRVLSMETYMDDARALLRLLGESGWTVTKR